MKDSTKKKLKIAGGVALTAASFVPAVRGARILAGAGKIAVKSKVGRAIIGRAARSKAAETAYKKGKPLYDHVSRKFRREEEEIFKRK
jgi:hypothetical protein